MCEKDGVHYLNYHDLTFEGTDTRAILRYFLLLKFGSDKLNKLIFELMKYSGSEFYGHFAFLHIHLRVEEFYKGRDDLYKLNVREVLEHTAECKVTRSGMPIVRVVSKGDQRFISVLVLHKTLLTTDSLMLQTAFSMGLLQFPDKVSGNSMRTTVHFDVDRILELSEQ